MSKNSFQDILNKQKQESSQKHEHIDLKFDPYSEEKNDNNQQGFKRLLERKKLKAEHKRITSFNLKISTIQKMESLTKELNFNTKGELLEDIIDIAFEELKDS